MTDLTAMGTISPLDDDTGDWPDLTRCQRSVAHTPEPEACEPTYTLDRQIAQARRDMGKAEWDRLSKDYL
jgi:hypothetical protein